MRLMLMRHGNAGDKIKDDDEADLDRDLSPVGKQQVKALARHLEKNDMVPDAIFASPVKRTLQTAKILADRFFDDEDKVQIDPNLSESKPLEMSVMARLADTNVKRPLLVGHKDNQQRLHHLNGDFSPDPDPMATSELRVIKAKRSKAQPASAGQPARAKWKEVKRILPSDVDPDAQDLY